MRTTLALLVALCAVAATLGSVPFAQSPRSSTQLGGGPAVPPISPGVGIDANAGFVAVAFEDALDVVYLVSSTDAGQSWSAPLALSSPPGPKVLTSNSVQLIGFDAYVCWVVDVGGSGIEELWYVRVDVAGSPGIVTPPTKVPHGAPVGQIRDFDMEISFGGALRWLNFAQSVDPGPADVHEQLWVSSSTDGVAFASALIPTAFAPGAADVDAIDLDAYGPRVVVAWSDDSSGANDVFLSINHAGGLGSWSPAQIHVDATPAPAQQGEGLSVDAGATRTFVVWNEAPSVGGSQKPFGAVLDTIGMPLSAPFALGGALGDADDCSATLTKDGDAVALWRDDRTGPNEVWARVSKNDGTSFFAPAKLSTDGASSLDVDAGGKGVIAAVWTAGALPERVESAYSCDGGMTWTTLDLSSTSGDADSAAVGYDPFEKQVMAAWLSDDLGLNRAYSAGFGACLPPPPACIQAADLGPTVTNPALAGPVTTAALQSSASGEEGSGPGAVYRLYRGLDYTPDETKVNGLRPLPAQRLTVFYPTNQVKPSGGWPVLLFSPSGAFREAQAPTEVAALPYPLGVEGYGFTETYPLLEICAEVPEGAEDAPLGGFLYDALLEGWAVVCVGTVGIDSRLDAQGKLVPFGGQLLLDRDPNIFYPHTDGNGSPTAEWENFELFWGEKDFTWARQYLAQHAAELELDNDLVVTSGVSSGSVYAAFVALGPDRAHASGSSQVTQSTQCAGFIGFETPAWFPAFNEEVTAPHWEGPTTGQRAATMADASLGDLVASSVSTWIRQSGSLAASTPALLVFDEGVAADEAADFERDDGSGGCDSWPTATGDPCLSNALLPCVDCNSLDSICALLGFPQGCFCNPLVSRFCVGSDVEIIDFTRAHDSWNGVVLLQDLITYGHTNSQLLLESGVLSAHPTLPALQTAVYTDTSGTIPPAASDDPLVQELALSWLCQLRDTVNGTSSSCPVADYRNESPNPASLSLTPPVLGGTMTCVVDLDTTGHPMAQVIGLDTPASIPLTTYVLLCTDSGSGILFQSTDSGPLAVMDIAIPNGTYMAGSMFCVQAIHFGGGGGDALSNAQDVVVGL